MTYVVQSNSLAAARAQTGKPERNVPSLAYALQVVHVQASKLFDRANQTAAEAVASIRTVAAFSLQPQVSRLYQQQLVEPTKAIEKSSHTSGIGFGFSQFIIFAVYALGFW